jgi:hypothetical protein
MKKMIPKLYATAEIATKAKCSTKWVQRLADEMIAKGCAQKVGKTLVCSIEAVDFVLNRDVKRGRPAKASKPAPAKASKPAKNSEAQIAGVLAAKEGNYYIYYAEMDNGEHAYIRKSERKYDTAWQYSGKVTSGNKRGLSLYFTFGKQPNHWYKDKVVKAHQIKF